MQPETTTVMQIDEAEIEAWGAQAERDGYAVIPGLTGLALNVMCERHQAMYEGCDQEEVKLTIIQTFLENTAKACSREADEGEEPDEFAAFLKAFSAKGEHMCCIFPDKMHARLVAKTKPN
jgi:hypothetical protein